MIHNFHRLECVKRVNGWFMLSASDCLFVCASTTDHMRNTIIRLMIHITM